MKWIGLGLVAMLSGIWGCDNTATRDQGTEMNSMSESERATLRQTATTALTGGEGAKVVTAMNDFGLRLLGEVLKAEQGQNVFISPASVSIALTMTMNGAEGETEKAMADVLGVGSIPLDEVNNAYKNLALLLQSPDPKVQLEVANSLWAREGVKFKADFMERAQRFFDAEINTLNFRDPAAAANINRWVSEHTNNKIDKIIDVIPDNAVMYLINAIYFHGLWKDPFKKDSTKEMPFTLLDGKSKQVPMMHRSDEFQYMKDPKFQAVAIPYGNGRISMYIFVPEAKSGLPEFLSGLNGGNWAKWMSSFKSNDGQVYVPRWRSEFSVTLNDALKAMGMGIAFDEARADFTGMRTERDLFVQRVLHKTYVDVNEEGTEAAAVTGVEVGATAMPVEREPFVLKADRPFFYAIRDNQTGVILFTGVVVNP